MINLRYRTVCQVIVLMLLVGLLIPLPTPRAGPQTSRVPLLPAASLASAAEAPPDEPRIPVAACRNGEQTSGARYRICMPAAPAPGWNGDLVVYAHGYVFPGHPLYIPGEAAAIEAYLLARGYAFASTSFSTNGLAVVAGLADLRDLVDLFTTTQQVTPAHVYIVGTSLGGLIATMAVERHPDTFAGGLAMCGLYDGFGTEAAYIGDVRVVFDYLFPGVLPPTPTSIPPELANEWAWSAYYIRNVMPILTTPTSMTLVSQLFDVVGAPSLSDWPGTANETMGLALSFHILGTNDATAKIGGVFYDNQQRVYTRGGADDDQLNAGVQRIGADPAALEELARNYATTGQLTRPLVTLHTTGDPVVPYVHATNYLSKTQSFSVTERLYQHIAIERYGHCTFGPREMEAAFERMVGMAAALPGDVGDDRLPPNQAAPVGGQARIPHAAMP